ncbi:hypothetical protein CDD81_1406 [Ophiocordyceps australis]|uniref:O-methyltransferase domain-containing protein n=1 Tax=Ophiocordyceps australis TaxID=1399860 RepID=A0A2C5XYW4_9HYPO|nr:hypothetical protein CDD81_1406 [Ophiocordyceps australis]
MDASPDFGLYSNASTGPKAVEYSKDHSVPLPQYLIDYHASVKARRQDSRMLSELFQSQLYVFLARSWASKRVLEIGLYVGFSAMVWSHAIGPDGSITALELSPELAQEAQEAMAENKVDNVQVIVGDASQTISQLCPNEPYDLAFIDADKPSYPKYLALLLEKSQPGAQKRLLRPGAIIVADNVLRYGHVVDSSLGEEQWPVTFNRTQQLEAMRNFNDRCSMEPRLEVFMLPFWDGLVLARLID